MHVKVHGLGANLKQQAVGISGGRGAEGSKQTRPKTERPPLNLHSYGLGLVWGAGSASVSLSKLLITFSRS